MADETQTKIITLLDVLAHQIGGIATHVDTISSRVEAIAADVSEHRKETIAGFERVERRLGVIETRVETLEDTLRLTSQDIDKRVTVLESR